MKKSLVALLAIVSLGLGGRLALAENGHGHMDGHLHGDGGGAESTSPDVKRHQACSHCGMDRGKFAHSRMLVTYSDGSAVGVCSLHCADTELKSSKGKIVKTVEVADMNTKKLVNAGKATWVIGGSVKGVMTGVAKWAFEKKDDAAIFIKKYGGKLSTYKEALILAGKE